ncbi:MAG: M1 family peptidase, partial [Gelidibacter sp.]
QAGYIYQGGYKGSNILHTLRHWINDDAKWREILRGLNETLYHQTVTTNEIEDYISKSSGLDLTAFFNQYLRHSRVPTLEYGIKDNVLTYRWIHSVEGFDMPIKIKIGKVYQWISPTVEIKSQAIKGKDIIIDDNFYVRIKRI